MLAIEGYTPFRDFLQACSKHIVINYFAWLEHNPEFYQKVSEQSFIANNIRGAAQSMSLAIAKEHWGGLKILTPNLDIISLSRWAIEADFYLVEESLVSGIYVSDRVSFFRTNKWQKSFIEHEVYVKSRHWPYPQSIVDWDYGTLRLEPIEKFVSTLQEITGGEVNRVEPSSDDSLHWKLVSRFEQAKIVLATLSHYRGCPLVVPTGWQSFFRQDEATRGADFDGRNPWERIIEFAERNPLSTKTDIKTALFPQASARAFGAWWATASSILPILSRPGRRPDRPDSKRCIDTNSYS